MAECRCRPGATGRRRSTTVGQPQAHPRGRADRHDNDAPARNRACSPDPVQPLAATRRPRDARRNRRPSRRSTRARVIRSSASHCVGIPRSQPHSGSIGSVRMPGRRWRSQPLTVEPVACSPAAARRACGRQRSVAEAHGTRAPRRPGRTGATCCHLARDLTRSLSSIGWPTGTLRYGHGDRRSMRGASVRQRSLARRNRLHHRLQATGDVERRMPALHHVRGRV